MRLLRSLAVLFGSATLLQALPSWSAAADQGSRSTESRIEQSAARTSKEAQLEEQLAHSWGLQPQEWARYRQLMQGPLGIYSPNLDPLTALGIEARSTEEQRRYAELQVRMEARRTEKTLAYQRAYDAAWKRVYPTLRPINSPAATADAATSGANAQQGRIAVFVKDHCGRCEERVQQLQAAGRGFDLYLVGSRQNDALIRQWAAHARIDPAKVRARKITLNHDSGRWLSISGQGELPAVVREVNGRWQRE